MKGEKVVIKLQATHMCKHLRDVAREQQTHQV